MSVQDNIVPFPASCPEAARLSMMLSGDAQIVVISGQAVIVEAEGEFRFVETVEL